MDTANIAETFLSQPGADEMPQPLMKLVHEVALLLRQTGLRVVFAESCTAGLVTAALARVPGISESLCGSAVVYRLDTKSKWLEIPAELLADPGPVSDVIARLMAARVLAITPEADLAVSVTGHLGPGAPSDLDGVVYIGAAWRDDVRDVLRETSAEPTPSNDLIAVKGTAVQYQLPLERSDTETVESSSLNTGDTRREQRQWMAVELVLETVKQALAIRTTSVIERGK